MADSLPSDGSNLKSNRKDPYANIMPVSSTQQKLTKITSNGNSIDNQNDLTKNKKGSTVKCEKFSKNAVNNKESVTNTSVALAKTTTITPPLPPKSASVSASSVLKPATTNIHQVNYPCLNSNILKLASLSLKLSMFRHLNERENIPKQKKKKKKQNLYCKKVKTKIKVSPSNESHHYQVSLIVYVYMCF